MTRKLIALALLAAFLILSGCQPANTYDPATDWQKFNMVSDGIFVGEAADGYYLPVGHFLQYVDKETMTPQMLCSEPGCLHNEYPDEDDWNRCGAFYNASFWDVPTYYVGGYVYTFTRSEEHVNSRLGWADKLLRTNPDGTGRTEICTFPESTTNYEHCIHRSVFYYTRDGYTDSGEIGSSVYALPLDQEGAEPAVLFEVIDGTRARHLSGMTAYGNYLYVHEDTGGVGTRLHIYDLKSGKLSTMPIPEGLDGINRSFILQDKLYVQYYDLESPEAYDVTSRAVFYRANLDGTGQKLVHDELPTGWSYSDGEYLYHVTRRAEPESRYTADKLYVLNADFETVCTYDFANFTSDGELLRLLDIVPMHDGRVFLRASHGGQWAYYSFTREEVEAGSIRPQKLIEYDNSDYFKHGGN